ncbi:MAG: iron uptake transporter deferrochelatase/peroxidase subunit [Micromonosporaceae bacterium]
MTSGEPAGGSAETPATTEPGAATAPCPGPGAVSRRRVIGLAGAGVAGITVGTAAGAVAHDLVDGTPTAVADGLAEAVPFHGVRQAGITTPMQDRLHFVAFDVLTDSRDELVALLKEWTAAAERMTRGRDAGAIGAVDGLPEAPPDDTGEAIGLPPSGLTLTIGFGPSLFTDAKGRDRYGIAARRPTALKPLPHFVGDEIDPGISGGDIAIQACAHDPQVAVHAIRNLARIGFGKVAVRWSQLGFGRTSSTSRTQQTPRNLMGFKDGTNNLKAEDAKLLDEHVWVARDDDQPWLAGGSFLVTRRIRMMIEPWDRTPLGDQEGIIGRVKGTGAPLTGKGEFDALDFKAKTDGEFTISDTAHVRLAHPSHNGGARMLRRGYNFVDGSDGLGRLNAGLFFIAYQRDPSKGFIPVQRSLSTDVLNEYIRHVGTGIFACPPGVARPGDYWGRTLFG